MKVLATSVPVPYSVLATSALVPYSVLATSAPVPYSVLATSAPVPYSSMFVTRRFNTMGTVRDICYILNVCVCCVSPVVEVLIVHSGFFMYLR